MNTVAAWVPCICLIAHRCLIFHVPTVPVPPSLHIAGSLLYQEMPCLHVSDPTRPSLSETLPKHRYSFKCVISSPPKTSASTSPPSMPTQLIRSPPIPVSPSRPDVTSTPLICLRSPISWSKRTIVGRMWRVVGAGFAAVVTKAVADAVLKYSWIESACVWIYRTASTARCKSTWCCRYWLCGRRGCRRRCLG